LDEVVVRRIRFRRNARSGVRRRPAGEFDMMLLARFRDTDHLRTFLQNDLRRVAGIASVRTLLVLDETPQRSLLHVKS
jgi:DNA-binding Lrp family transcriptional regulator